MDDQAFKKSVPLRDGERRQLLDKLDEVGQQGRPSSRREHIRVEYRAAEIPIIISHPGGTTGRFLVSARNLSQGGMGFVHGGFVHPGSECKVLLVGDDGSKRTIVGHVRSCRHLVKNLHEVGIQFTEKIDPKEFCAQDARNLGTKVCSTDVPELKGRVLILVGSTPEAKILARRLESAGLTASCPDCLGAAIDHIKRLAFDAAITDMRLPTEGDTDPVAALREAGHAGPIIGLIADGGGESSEAQPADAPVRHLLRKPVSAQALLRAMEDVLAEGKRCDETPIHSQLANQSAASKLISAYIEEARQMAESICQAEQTADEALIRKLCARIKSTAIGYGFPALFETARVVLDAVDAGKPLDQARNQIKDLVSICRRLAPGKPEQPPQEEG